MEHYDFTMQRIQLHNNIIKAIVALMKEADVTEIDLKEKGEECDSAWLVTCNPEMVEVTNIRRQGDTLLYKGKAEGSSDESWQRLDVESSVIAATIDTIYEAVWQRLAGDEKSN